jgi:hypothetical protein
MALMIESQPTSPDHVTAALLLTNQFQEFREATLGGTWGRREMLAPSLV